MSGDSSASTAARWSDSQDGVKDGACAGSCGCSSHPIAGHLWWYTDYDDLVPEDSVAAQKLLVPQLFRPGDQLLNFSFLSRGAYSQVYCGALAAQHLPPCRANSDCNGGSRCSASTGSVVGSVPVAVKVIDPTDPSTDEDSFPAVLREVSAMCRLAGCRGAAQLLDWGAWRGKYVLLMPRYGSTLAAWRQDQGEQCDPVAALALFHQLLEALQGVHRAGVVHGDVKPANIFLLHPPAEPQPPTARQRQLQLQGASACGPPPLRLVLGDFGSALTREQCTVVREARGTEAFMAPEVALTGDCSEAADVWSAGCVLYYLMTNDLLVRSAHDAMYLSPHSRFTAPCLANALLRGMLARDACQRFSVPKCLQLTKALMHQAMSAGCAAPPPWPPPQP